MIVVRHGDEVHKVPCGKCAFCLSNKRSQWMFRIHYEMRNQEFPGYFLTMTYDERHVKRVGNGRLSLRFRDVQLWLKKVRKRKYYAKYIIIGEYGSQTQRPHYHALIWTDCPPLELERIWTMGSIHFGRLTMASAMYTLKYIIQPKQKDETRNDGVEKTRAQFSKGLGISFLTCAMYDYLTDDFDNPVMFSVLDGRKVAVPLYYKRKIYTKYQLRRAGHKAKWESVREKRKLMRWYLSRGVQNASAHIQGLRVEQARRIIQKTKFNLSI